MPGKKRKLSAAGAEPIKVTLQDVSVTSQQHLQAIMRAVGVKTLKSSSGDPVYEFSELKAEGKYKPGDTKETRRPKRQPGYRNRQQTNRCHQVLPKYVGLSLSGEKTRKELFTWKMLMTTLTLMQTRSGSETGGISGLCR